MVRQGIGKLGLALAIFFAFAMCILSLIFHPVEIPPIQYGLCLPSPDSWDFPLFGSWIINTFLIGCIALLLFIINRSYNFIRTTEPALTALFLVLATSSPWFTQSLNTSVLLCLANVVCLGIIFSSYDSRNATQEMFILGLVAGMGSMVQYAFLLMALVYFLWALFMKVLRVKETLALIFGILCPYWIALGTGWLHFSNLHFPSLTPLFSVARDHSDFLFLLIGIFIAALIGIIVAMVNFIKLYAGNSKVNAMNQCVTILGAAAIIFILVDFDNMPAYVTTLYMGCAVQLANICALWNPGKPWVVTVVPAVLFMAIFAGSLIF